MCSGTYKLFFSLESAGITLILILVKIVNFVTNAAPELKGYKEFVTNGKKVFFLFFL